MSRPKIVAIVGKSKSGKTTLLEKVIPELNRRGYRVGTVKHHFHAGFDFDKPGKDSWRMAAAGASAVSMVSPGKMFLIQNTEAEMALDDVRDLMSGVDIVLAEGFLSTAQERIEIVREDNGGELLCPPEELRAVITDMPIHIKDLKRIPLDDISCLADFLESRYIRSNT
ncbi:MAG: molybdopterin-guanine dinucleotide biosynthesis protein B [Spirochaetales bacterium]|nr:molybdopterin-guanine dinucleotide biosynthesis protein B [Spirochaetales bacterium]